MKEHKYKGFNIVRNGTKSNPYNIYKETGYGHGEHIGFDTTLQNCKKSIDDYYFETDINELRFGK